jgi:hypothetical protein
MFVDDRQILIDTIASPQLTTASRASLTGLSAGKDLVMNRSDFNSLRLAYPSQIGYYTAPWDCDNRGTFGNTNDWMTQAIAGGTINEVTEDIAPGTPTNTQGVDMANHPGVISINSGTNINSGAQVCWGNPTGSILLKGGERFDCVFFTVELANTFSRLGFHDSVTAIDTVDGVYFDVGTGTGILSARTRNNGVLSAENMMTLAVNTWYHCKIQINADATAATFGIYDMIGALLVPEVTLTTNIPTTPGRDVLPRAMACRDTAGARLLYQIDFISWSTPLQRGAAI